MGFRKISAGNGCIIYGYQKSKIELFDCCGEDTVSEKSSVPSNHIEELNRDIK